MSDPWLSDDEKLMKNALGYLVEYVQDLESRNHLTRLYGGRRAVSCICDRLGIANPLEQPPPEGRGG